MFLFKYLIASLLSLSDGWSPVEKPPKPSERMENDPSIWALFSKDMGDERFQVRIPGEPVYKYSDTGVLEISSSENGQIFRLMVEESGPEKGDLLYQSEGKWVREHFVRSGPHFYHFTTLSDTPESGVHDLFISSFFIEKN